jgi:polyhydroxybutyrate depolymerase
MRTLAPLLALLVACGQPYGDGPSAPDQGRAAPAPDQGALSADGGTAAAPDQGEPPPPPASCPAGLALPASRDFTLSLDHGGLKRSALVHIPASYDGKTPVGLVFNNHGNMCSAQMQAQMTHLADAADKRGLITVTPQGTGGLTAGWSSGASPLGYLYEKVDDVGFFAAMIEELAKRVCLDRARVYCAGFSLGGSMCYRLSCDLADRIRAIASVAGPDGTTSCKPARALPLLHVHGTADSFASYKGDGADKPNKGAEWTVANHAARCGCQATPTPGLVKGKVSCKTYGGCKDGAEATLCTVEGGGHTWPGGEPWLLGGTVNKDVSATEMILDFFDRYR